MDHDLYFVRLCTLVFRVETCPRLLPNTKYTITQRADLWAHKLKRHVINRNINMGGSSATCCERLDSWVSTNMFALKCKKLDELQYCSSPLPTVCCLLCHFIVWARHVKSTLGLSPAVCELRVCVRLAALCCVSDCQSSWQHLSRPPNHRVTLWLRTATFLCASLCALVRLCAFAYVQLCVFACMRENIKDGRCVFCDDGCLLAWWQVGHWTDLLSPVQTGETGW